MTEPNQPKKLNQKTAAPNNEIAIEGTFPHQIAAPDFKRSNKEIEKPFVNEYGVVIGDSFYESANSPLNNWSLETDPEVMAGDQWVHPTNDIGWNTPENRKLLENKPPKPETFMHTTKDAGYGVD